MTPQKLIDHVKDGKSSYYLDADPQPQGDCQVLNEAHEIISTIGPISLPTCKIDMRNHTIKEHITKRSLTLFKEYREIFVDDEPLFILPPQKFNKRHAVAIDIHQSDRRDLAITIAVGTIYRGML